MKSDPLFERADDGTWLPRAIVRGPFDGMQGGAVAGLMCAVAEKAWPEGFATLAIDAHFLRPCPLAPITVTTRQVHAGGRVAVVEVALSAEGKPRATAMVSAASAVAIPALAVPPDERHYPTLLSVC